MKRKYKVDHWSNPRIYKSIYVSAYYRPWFWPFWFRCVSDTEGGMCRTIEEAEQQAFKHAKGECISRPYKNLGWM